MAYITLIDQKKAKKFYYNKTIAVFGAIICAFHYNEERKTLTVGFKNGDQYQYYHVQKSIFNKILSSYNKAQTIQDEVIKRWSDYKKLPAKLDEGFITLLQNRTKHNFLSK